MKSIGEAFDDTNFIVRKRNERTTLFLE